MGLQRQLIGGNVPDSRRDDTMKGFMPRPQRLDGKSENQVSRRVKTAVKCLFDRKERRPRVMPTSQPCKLFVPQALNSQADPRDERVAPQLQVIVRQGAGVRLDSALSNARKVESLLQNAQQAFPDGGKQDGRSSSPNINGTKRRLSFPYSADTLRLARHPRQPCFDEGAGA
jgi:hypothetical protein